MARSEDRKQLELLRDTCTARDIVAKFLIICYHSESSNELIFEEGILKKIETKGGQVWVRLCTWIMMLDHFLYGPTTWACLIPRFCGQRVAKNMWAHRQPDCVWMILI